METTYRAVLHGDHIEWIDPPPDIEQPVQVHITLVTEPSSVLEVKRGQAMADALAGLAHLGGLPEIADPIAWQREIRQDRELSGREP